MSCVVPRCGSTRIVSCSKCDSAKHCKAHHPQHIAECPALAETRDRIELKKQFEEDNVQHSRIIIEMKKDLAMKQVEESTWAGEIERLVNQLHERDIFIEELKKRLLTQDNRFKEMTQYVEYIETKKTEQAEPREDMSPREKFSREAIQQQIEKVQELVKTVEKTEKESKSRRMSSGMPSQTDSEVPKLVKSAKSTLRKAKKPAKTASESK